MGQLAGTLVLTLLLLSTTARWWDAVRWPFKVALGVLYGAMLLVGVAAGALDRSTLASFAFLLLLIAATTPWWTKVPRGVKLALRVPYILLFVARAVAVLRG
jgi:hypothetical protein